MRGNYQQGGGQAPVPPELEAAFEQSPEARRAFDALTPSHRREYLHWIAQARTDDTRERRAAQTVMRLLV